MEASFIKEYLPYLPVIIAILAAAMGYITGQRTGKINRFLKQVNINLDEAIGPMFFKMRITFGIEDPQNREEHIDSFYKLFSYKNASLYKLGSRLLINGFIETEDYYMNFKKTRTTEDWNKFWKQFSKLKDMLEDEYWVNFNSLYGEYRWFQRSLSSNMFVKIWNEILKVLIQACEFICIVTSLYSLYSVWDFFFVKKLPEDSMAISVLMLLFAIMLFCLVNVIGINILGLKSQKESLVGKLTKRYIPSFLKELDKKITETKKTKNNAAIPEMYKQRMQD